jgi:hypothetical protein
VGSTGDPTMVPSRNRAKDLHVRYRSSQAQRNRVHGQKRLVWFVLVWLVLVVVGFVSVCFLVRPSLDGSD